MTAPVNEAIPVETAPPAPRRLNWKGMAVDVLLIALIAVGVYFRFSWVNWNQDTDLHPDEYGLTSTLTRLAVPKTLGDYFNTRLSSLSPYQKYDLNGQPTEGGPDNRMRWGQWPITIIRWMAEATDNTDYGKMRLLGRRLSAAADTLAVLVTLLIGWRLYSARAGLFGAALSALAVMPIQQSHFMTADNFASLFTALAMLFAVLAAQSARASGRWRPWLWYGLFGLTFGMALASRINLLPLFGEILVAAFIAYHDELFNNRRDLPRPLLQIALRVGLAALAAALTFRVTQPMSFRARIGDTTVLTLTPNVEWVESMKVAQAESSGLGGGPPGEQWTNRPALVFPFLNMVLWGMGLPLGLAAWAGLAWAGWRALRSDEWRRHLLPLTWAGGYFLFMGTRWVKSIRYFLPIYPFMALFAAWALLELWRKSQVASPRSEVGRPTSNLGLRTLSVSLSALVAFGTLAWAWGFTGIYRRDNTRIQATRWIYQNIPAPLNLHLDTADGPVTEPLPASNGAQVAPGIGFNSGFTARTDASVTAVTIAHARSVVVGQAAVLHVMLARDPDGTQLLAAADVSVPAAFTDQLRGDPLTVPLGPVEVKQGERYFVVLAVPSGGPVALSGTTLANESWDEGLPLRIDGRDGFGGLYTGLTMEVRWPDDENKRQMFLTNLAQADYIFLPSQRAIWSAARLPLAYPMTLEYYRALFDGRLGFDLAAQFQSPFVFGPLQISDVGGSLAWGRAPTLPLFNDNPFSAEEAFSVYDHAPVWIFRKRADFDLARAQAVLEAIDLSTVVNQGPRDATRTPATLLRLPPDRLAAQRAGGTWRDMFNVDSLLNKYQPLGGLAWWLALLLLGWLAFPLAFAAFGGLSDRGYALAKTVALLVVAWLAWMLGSFQILPFTRLTIALCCLALAAVSALIFWFRRAEMITFVRGHWRYILTVEGVFLALFIFDLLIRLGNPDLWHPNFGGEKPMDFSYFNAVLKSTSFPPYDPWLAGGYLNYYYYGFVIVGLLTKLLGIVPAFAYNLILPMLFGLLGVNAFGVAFNLVNSRARDDEQPAADDARAMASEQLPPPEPAGQNPEAESPSSDSGPVAPLAPRRPARPNPYIAGVAAALMIVVLGNLGQVHVVLDTWQKAADHGALAASWVGDSDLTATLSGGWRVITGAARMNLGTGSWYWDATRIIPPENGEAGPITEFPFFTFLYADLHAHMIDLPFTVLALAWAVAYLLGAARKRSRMESVALWALGGLAFGVARPTNTWDFPAYLVLGAAAVATGEWLRQPKLSRAVLWAIAWRVALLVGLALAFYQPYAHWYGSGYNSAKLWDGSKTPLSAYLYVHGLFFFLIISFLVWETRRWLAETSAAVLAGARGWLPAAAFAAAALLVLVAVCVYLKIMVAALALPLMAWAGLLLLRAPEALSPAKRAVLFLFGTGLMLTLVVEVVVLEGDISRMNTVFKFYLQVWTLFSVAAGASLAWVWAALPEWKPRWQAGWTSALILLTAGAALYTATAAAAKISDRFPQQAAQPADTPVPACRDIAGVPNPYAGGVSLAPSQQPHSLDGLDYLRWGAYCDHTYFLPLSYDYDAIRWMQDHVDGSPVIVEAQSFDLYRMSSRYTWNTGLPDVVGWDWHERQQRALLPTQFISERGAAVTNFYQNPDPASVAAFVQQYDVRYIIVGPMERAYYIPEGLAKFDALVSRGLLSVAYHNPGVTIYAANP